MAKTMQYELCHAMTFLMGYSKTHASHTFQWYGFCHAITRSSCSNDAPLLIMQSKFPKNALWTLYKCIQAFMLQHVPDAIFSFWYRNIKAAENFRGNISFVKTQTRLKLLCLSWICWRCERQSWAESILGSSCWFSADDLKFEFWPVEIDSIYLGGTKLAEEESVSKKVCFERKSKYQHGHQKDPGL